MKSNCKMEEENQYRLLHSRKFNFVLNDPIFRIRCKVIKLNAVRYIESSTRFSIIKLIQLKELDKISIIVDRHFDNYITEYNQLNFDRVLTDRNYILRSIHETEHYLITDENENINTDILGNSVYKVVDEEFIINDIIEEFKDGSICNYPVAELLPYIKDEIKYKMVEDNNTQNITENKDIYNCESCPICFEEWNEAIEKKIINCCHSLCKRCYKHLTEKKCPICRKPISIYKPKRVMRSEEELQNYMNQEECDTICEEWFDCIEDVAESFIEKYGLLYIFEMDNVKVIDYDTSKYRELKKIYHIQDNFVVNVLSR